MLPSEGLALLEKSVDAVLPLGWVGVELGNEGDEGERPGVPGREREYGDDARPVG